MTVAVCSRHPEHDSDCLLCKIVTVVELREAKTRFAAQAHAFVADVLRNPIPVIVKPDGSRIIGPYLGITLGLS